MLPVPDELKNSGLPFSSPKFSARRYLVVHKKSKQDYDLGAGCPTTIRLPNGPVGWSIEIF